jgi:nucleotide-binding universal stress UspA family protein
VQTILVPVDGSEPALRAVDVAIQRALTARAALHLLFVHLPPPDVGVAEFYTGAAQLQKLAAAHGEWVLSTAEKRIPVNDVRYAKEVREGDPAEVIVLRAHELRCEAIIMGARGIGGREQSIPGSVARRVAGLSKLPLTLVP